MTDHRDTPQPAPPAQGLFVPGVPAESGPRLPHFADPDPMSRLVENPHVVESERVCRWLGCNTPVGRAIGEQPAATEGFCHVCGTEFSFSPKLPAGALVGGHYKVLGCLAHGGMGWVYLAEDQNLHGKYVVLKGLLNNKDTFAMQTAWEESRALTELEHANVVRIISVVGYPDLDSRSNRYLVLDYVGGRTLSEIAASGLGVSVEDALLYVGQILEAMIYLHESAGLLYCDMKPANVMYGEGGVKVIDFGGVRRIGDPVAVPVGTKGFQIPAEEYHERGLTVRSDIHTVGVTLWELVRRANDRADPRIAFGMASVDRLVERATAPYERRFASAREMLVQVQGVVSEVYSLRTQMPDPPANSAFYEATEILDGGLGGPPPLRRFTQGDRTAGWAPPLQVRAPRPSLVASTLAPPVEDPYDRNYDRLHDGQPVDDGTMLTVLEGLQQEGKGSVELQLRRCRIQIRRGSVDAAHETLDRVRVALAERAPYDWRVDWHTGLLEMLRAEEDPDRLAHAEAAFRKVGDSLPGEEDPKLAVGLCAELRAEAGEPQRFEEARNLYQVVWSRDRSQISAAFGLVRDHLRAGRRAEAVRVLEAVSDRSRHLGAARIATVRISCARLPQLTAALRRSGGLPSDADLTHAVRQYGVLGLHHEAAERLLTVIREAALDRLLTPGPRCFPRGPVLGQEPSERSVRELLETSYRDLARQAGSKRELATLVDLANLVRPLSRV